MPTQKELYVLPDVQVTAGTIQEPPASVKPEPVTA
jgi:hypothetical protein